MSRSVNILEKIYEINNLFLKNCPKSDVTLATEITVHNINEYDYSFFSSIYFLNNIETIEIGDSYSSYIPNILRIITIKKKFC